MSSSKNLEYEKTAFLSKSNSAFIEEMHLKFVNNDPTLPASWKRYFNEIGDASEAILKEINGPSWNPAKRFSIKQNHLKHMHEDIDKLHIKMDRFLYWLLGGLGAIILTLLGTS